MLCAVSSVAQIEEPVKWKFSAERTAADEAVFTATATIEATWHVYALSVSNDPNAVGPMPTVVKIKPSNDFKVKGKTTEGKYITHFDPNFEMDLNYFENTATFKQTLKLSTKAGTRIKGTIEYMACNDTKCIFPEPAAFDIMLAGEGEAPVSETTSAGASGEGSGILEPAKWQVNARALGGDKYDVVYTLQSEAGWHVYSQVLENKEGPEPTAFKFETGTDFTLEGNTREGQAIRTYDPNFMMNLAYFESGATFTQTVKANTPLRDIITSVRFMACNEEMCLPPREVFFKVNLETGVAAPFDPLANTQAAALANDPFRLPQVDLQNPANNCGKEAEEEQTLWIIFVLGFLGGLLALFTPCVFPMIPLTVSFFTKGAGKKNGKLQAILYGLFIMLIYFMVSLPFHLSKSIDPDSLNNISTNVYLNIGFFVVFVVFAISFFGYFEITLPSSFANKVDSASNVGGIIGIFFMALTLVIVSFSCTGPLLGSVIGSVYADKSAGLIHILGMELSVPATKLSVAMIAFGLALGLPFALFAAFPGMLKKLPKSGGWLDDFKVSLGFIELALAVKFVSNADLVVQTGWLKREVFFGIWLVIGIAWVLYLLGVFRFKPGQGSQGIGKIKAVLTTIIALFTLRLVPGVFPPNDYNRFAFLSGFPPPRSYTVYHYEEEFKIYRDLTEAQEAAKREGKPLFVDFTGWACVNCRKMEENVWIDEKVKSLLAQGYIMCSLYVDEKVELPTDQQFIYTTPDGRKKEIRTVGNKWSTLQTQTFNNNSQPFYALLTPEGTLLNPPRGYTPQATEYSDWLQCGLNAYEQQVQ